MTQLKSNKNSKALATRPQMSLPIHHVADMSLDELRTQHRERAETNRRVEELKVSLLRMADHNIDQVVRLIRRWLNS